MAQSAVRHGAPLFLRQRTYEGEWERWEGSRVKRRPGWLWFRSNRTGQQRVGNNLAVERPSNMRVWKDLDQRGARGEYGAQPSGLPHTVLLFVVPFARSFHDVVPAGR